MRYRASSSSLGNFAWVTANGELFRPWGYNTLAFALEPTAGQWQTARFYFPLDRSLTGLSLGLGRIEDLQIDEIVLGSVNVEAALAKLGEAIPQSRGGHVRRNRAWLYASLGRWEAALADFREIGGVRNPFYEMLLSAQLGDREAYRTTRRQALAEFSDNSSASVVLTELTARAALLLPVEGDEVKHAVEMADRALKAPGTDHRRWRQLTKGLAEFRSGQFESAIKSLELSQQGPPDAPAEHLEAQALLVLAMAHQRTGQTDKARELLEQADKIIAEKLPKGDSGAIGENWPDWIITHALRREADGHLRVDDLTKEIAAQPGDVKLLASRATLLIDLGRAEEALADLTKIAELEAEDKDLLQKAARWLGRFGRREPARAAYAKLVKLEPKNDEWSFRLGQLGPETIAAWNFDFDSEAWSASGGQVAASAGGLHVQNTEGHSFLAADISARSGCKELTLRVRAKSATRFKFWWSTTQRRWNGNGYVGLESILPGDEWQTVRLYFFPDADLTGLVLEFGAGHQELQIDSMWLRSVDVQTALDGLAAEIRDGRNLPLSFFNRATLQGNLGRWEQALADCREANKLGGAWATWFCESLLLAHLGDREGFLQQRRETLQRAKAVGFFLFKEPMTRAALLLPLEGAELSLAAELADDALANQETRHRRWRQLTKALVEYRSGRFPSAVDWLEKSRKLPPEPPAPHLEAQTLLVLAMAHHRLGHMDQARSLFAEATKIIDGQLPKADSGALGEAWPDWIIAHVLRREAEAAIVGQIKSEDAGLTELAKAVDLMPEDKALLHKAANATRHYAETLRQAERHESARTYYRQARGWYEKLLALDGNNPQYAHELADVLLKAALADWQVLTPIESKSVGGATLTIQPDGSVLASGKSPDTDTYTITANTKLKGITAVRLEALADPTLPSGGPGRSGHGNFVVTEFEVFYQGGGDASGAVRRRFDVPWPVGNKPPPDNWTASPSTRPPARSTATRRTTWAGPFRPGWASRTI